MKMKKHLLLFVLVIIVGVFCIACGNKETDKTISTAESNQEKEDSQEPLEEETTTLSLNNTYITKFGEINAITYPTFAFDYPDNWTISQEEVTQTSETVTLTNERGHHNQILTYRRCCRRAIRRWLWLLHETCRSIKGR